MAIDLSNEIIFFRPLDEHHFSITGSFSFNRKMKNISWMSMRKITYQFERSDLDNAISVLEKMIKKIKEYY